MVALIVVPSTSPISCDIHVGAVLVSLVIGLMRVPIGIGGLRLSWPEERSFTNLIVKANPRAPSITIFDKLKDFIVLLFVLDCGEIHSLFNALCLSIVPSSILVKEDELWLGCFLGALNSISVAFVQYVA